MKAVDTNILARFMLDDDPVQSPIARDLVKAGVFVPLTVLLELGWLLQSRYGLAREHLAASLLDLFDVPGVVVEDDGAVRGVVAAFAKGGDFADHIHMVASKGVEAFVTFDRRVVASEGVGVPVEIVG